MFLVKPPTIIKPLVRELIWEIPNDRHEVFLTFDDGPLPGVTDVALDILAEFNAKATFFCLGKNVVKHPNLFKRIIEEGHAVGNHTFSHVNGWATDNEVYFEEVERCQELTKTELFRPPYGRIRRSQVKKLSRQFKLIMWSIISGDFDQSIPKEKVLANVTSNIGEGSIVVFHDSEKAKRNMLYALPEVLKLLQNQGLCSMRIDLADKLGSGGE